ncbi:2-dehydro-3-deoxygluconokinase [Hydrogenophaga crassostreae]|uniref:2-dehydro-3-deoxygluconokinase n=1 Tax=Hydrogenophaga crassostreae TaxID=1763535 RepID=A0A167H1K0_9BURK|nr:sugar kinase [Hydrogenophaga crassostreae]AOW12955.1 2-dehydro-3-deoxygluconokinase [Hydrogenophaga crassostreae]OAD40138.1 2-dehydro-3-deoxygluconokinase [Hydrogenophaga crassostreae]
MQKPIDLIALGEPMVEFNQTRPGEPVYLQGFGGDTSNAAIAAARAGARAAYLTRLGADHFGDTLMALWETEGVDSRAIERDPNAATGIYFVHHGKTGHGFSYMRAGSAASLMAPADLTALGWTKAIASAKILHVSGISLAISPSACETSLQAMREARAAQTLVSFDSNLRLKLWSLEQARAGIAQAVALCDLFLPSLEDMAVLTGITAPDAVVDWGHRQGAKQVVLKLGEHGALVSDGVQRQKVEGLPVKLVDATGAGDCFCGNLLARLAQGDELVAATRYANQAAALSVQGFGAVGPLPTAGQVNALL